MMKRKKLKIEDDKRPIPREDVKPAMKIDFELVTRHGKMSPLAAKVLQNELNRNRNIKKNKQRFPQDINSCGKRRRQ